MVLKDVSRNVITIMFWNANLGLKADEKKKEKFNRINDAIIYLVKTFDVAILLLAEYPYDGEYLSDRLSVFGRDVNTAYFVNNERMRMLYDHRFSYQLVRDDNYSFVSSIMDQLTDFNFLLSGVHLPSKLHRKEDDIVLETRNVMNLIKEAQKEAKTEKSIILGDFNLSPYDKGLINCDSFHALPVSDIVKKKEKRIVNGKEYQMFYNPMWNFLGDFAQKSYTYYYDSGGVDNVYKYIYDQVLISAQMIDLFIPESLSVVSDLEDFSLVNINGIPDKKTYSDHLPIIFSIEEEKVNG